MSTTKKSKKQPAAATCQLTPAQVLGTMAVDAPALPLLDMSVTISELTRNIVLNLPKHKLFMYKNKCVTVDTELTTDKDGNTFPRPLIKEMDRHRFATWIEQHMAFCKNSYDRQLTSLGDPKIKQILASDIFLNALPKIREICPVRMPVWTGKQNPRPALSIKGYDPATELYTLETAKFNASTRLTHEQCRTQLAELLHGFPWADITDTSRTFDTSRNVAAFVAYMVGQFCRHLITLQPMVLFNANQQGSGKTLLAALGLAAVHGAPTVTPYPDNDDELRQTLFSKLAAGASYCLLDDLPSLTSKTINQFTTAPSLSLRKMYTQEDTEHPNAMQLISTGNDLRTTTDIERRAMIIDLFCAEKVTDIEHSNHLDIFHLNRKALRAQLLSVLWSMVSNWTDVGCPILCAKNAKASFERFAEIAGSITKFTGFADPFEKRINPGTGGDTAAALLEQLIQDIATSSCPEFPASVSSATRVLCTDECLQAAIAHGIADILVSGYDKLKSLGMKLSKLKGRRFADKNGRLFQFGRRRSASRTNYEIIFYTNTPPTENETNQ